MTTFLAAFVVLVGHSAGQDSCVEKLIANLKSGDPEVRRLASEELAKIDGLPEATIKPLSDALLDSDIVVRCNVVHALKNVGRRFPRVTESLVKALEDEGAVASQAESALGELGKASVAPLKAALEKRPVASHNWTIYQILGNIGPDARDAVPLLEKGLAGKDSGRYYAAEAIVLIDPGNKAVKEVLEAAMRRPEREWQLHGAEGLARSSHFKTKEALGVLLGIATDDRASLNNVGRAIRALGHFGAEGKEVIPRLEERMNDKAIGGIPEFHVLLATTIFKMDRNHPGARKVLRENILILQTMSKGKGNAAALRFAKDIEKILSQLECDK